jgi:hypothetical protein
MPSGTDVKQGMALISGIYQLNRSIAFQKPFVVHKNTAAYCYSCETETLWTTGHKDLTTVSIHVRYLTIVLLWHAFAGGIPIQLFRCNCYSVRK